MTKLTNGRILIAGRGVSGCGAAHALARAGACFDVAEGKQAVDCVLSRGYSLIVASPGINPAGELFSAAAGKGVEIISEIELGYMLNRGKIAAVTGTNGKTTVCKMLTLMLSQRYRTELCGNIGKSFSETAADGNYDVAVVEISSFQLETIKEFRPDVAVITNIEQDHLDRHLTMDRYAEIKKRIAMNQTETDTLVLSQDGIPIKYLAGFAPRGKTVFGCVRGKIDGAYKDNDRFYYFDDYIADKKDLPFSERHNYENFLLASAAARSLGITCDEIRRAIRMFTPEPHRLALVRELNGVKFYDDSKGTNVAATRAALSEMKGSVCLIAGGSDKNCSYEKIFTTNAELKKINLIGSTRHKIREAAFFGGFSNVTMFETLKDAVADAYMSGCRNVLFSPACASFDMFENYERRGEAFTETVNELV